MGRLLVIALGATAIAVLLWLSVAADAAELARDAGWWALAALAFPAFVGFGAWRWG